MKTFLYNLLDRMHDLVIEERPTCLSDSDESCYGGDLPNPCVHCVPLILFHKLLYAVDASDKAHTIEVEAEKAKSLPELVTTLSKLEATLTARLEATADPNPDTPKEVKP